MAKREPRHKVARRFGVDIYGTAKPSLLRRLHVPPGQAGARRRRRLSEYALQLREKQKVRAIYGVQEGQFRRYFEEASRRPGNTGDILLALLERRLDNVLYRLGWARTRPMARQLVSHGHVRVNDRRVNSPSYRMSPGDRLALDETAQAIPVVQELLQGAAPPPPRWLERDGPTGRVLADPERSDVEPTIEEDLIVAFYSR